MAFAGLHARLRRPRPQSPAPGEEALHHRSLFVLFIAALGQFGSASAAADLGAGVKVGTLGIGFEARWYSPIPWFDLRIGANRLAYDESREYSGVGYDANLALDSYHLTGNISIPSSPFRLTVGAVANGNELRLLSHDSGDLTVNLDGTEFPAARVGRLTSTTSYASLAPYAGVGLDFEVLGRLSLNLDAGLMWHGQPNVTLEATNWDNLSPTEKSLLGPALDAERAALEDEIGELDAYPVLSLTFVYNF
jgi:hypothetical protein